MRIVVPLCLYRVCRAVSLSHRTEIGTITGTTGNTNFLITKPSGRCCARTGITNRTKRKRAIRIAALSLLLTMIALPASAASDYYATTPNRVPTAAKVKTRAVAETAPRTALTSTSSSQATSLGGAARARGGNARVVVNVRGKRAGAGSSGSTSQKPIDPPAGGTSGVSGAGDPSGAGFDPKHLPVASSYAPPVYQVNPCSGTPVSGGLQSGVVGLSMGWGGEFDNACRLHQLGQDDAAIAYLCRSNSQIRAAFQDVGRPCLQDRPKQVGAAPPVAAPAFTQRPLPDWCYAGGRVLTNHRECRR
jgi:hypothetical protein